MAKKRTLKKYGETFLTKERFATTNKNLAEKLPFQFRAIATTKGGRYKLSILGIINGFLPKITFGRYLTAEVTNSKSKLIKGYKLMKFKQR